MIVLVVERTVIFVVPDTESFDSTYCAILTVKCLLFVDCINEI